MFTVLKYLSDVYEYISGGTGDPLCDKLAQFSNKERTYLEMEGSVGLCTIVDGKYVDKEIKDYDRIRSSSEKINMVGKIASGFNKSSGNVVKYLGEKVLLEGDLENEYRLQFIFYSVWKDHSSIYVPRPLWVKNNVLRMEYFHKDKWKCIESVENSSKKWKGFLLLKQFFFCSFDKYLLHGDISPYNTLINMCEEEVKICALDYGLSSEISEEQMIGFNESTVNSPHQFADKLLQKWWKNDNNCPSQYTDEWLQSLKQNFDINVIISKSQLPSDSKTLELLAMFVRSILNLSNMAVRYSKF
jgi:predicted unusual protein kinase regulating ubiquinone biosynthesis (AarF/ABC1/UbiB family)